MDIERRCNECGSERFIEESDRVCVGERDRMALYQDVKYERCLDCGNHTEERPVGEVHY